MTPRPDPRSLPVFGRRPLGTGSLVSSIAIHGVAIVATFWVVPSLRPEPLYYPTVELRIMSTPPPQAPLPEEPEPAPEDELVVETPDDPEPPEVPEEDPVPVLEEEPEPEPEPDSAETAESEPEETAPPEEVPVPAESEEDEEDEGVADLQVRQEGFKADYPEYYARILVQVRRCLERTSEGRTARNLAATVRFVVERDGSTAGFGVERSSGDAPFDIAVLGALECAGMAGRLGPLPEDYPYEMLHFTLLVTPRGGGSEVPQTGDQR